MTKPPKYPSMIGASTLLVIFAVLCLTVFSLLSLSTAQSRSRLSAAAAENTRAYYQAACRAEEILSALRMGDLPDGVEVIDDIYRYSCPISDTQVLLVAVQLRENGSYSLLRWQSISTTVWEAEDAITVWDGSLPQPSE